MEQGDLHSLRVFNALLDRLSPDGTGCRFLVVRSTEVDIVKVNDTVGIHDSEHLAPGQSHGFQSSGLDDMDHGHTREAVLSRHLERLAERCSLKDSPS